MWFLSKNNAKATVLFFFGLGTIAFAPARSVASQSESPDLNASPVQTMTPEFMAVKNTESKTLWLIEKYNFQGKSLVLSLAGIQSEDPLGLSVLVLEPPPRDVFAKAFRIANPSEQKTTQENTLPLKDVPNPARGYSTPQVPRLTLHLRATAIKLSDLQAARKELLQQVGECGPIQRRAVAFIRPEAIVSRLKIPRERAVEWSSYGRAACVEWSDIPDAPIKSSDQTSVQPL